MKRDDRLACNLFIVFTLTFCLVACNQEERMYQAAKEQNTIEAYQSFLKEYPQSQFKKSLECEIQDIKWRKVKRAMVLSCGGQTVEVNGIKYKNRSSFYIGSSGSVGGKNNTFNLTKRSGPIFIERKTIEGKAIDRHFVYISDDSNKISKIYLDTFK